MTLEEAEHLRALEAAKIAEANARLLRPGNPRVFFDIEINGEPAGRIVFVLYAYESPRHAENFRAMCTGEKGGKATFVGMKFYRIIDQFIDQAGVGSVRSIWGSSFDDDPGGLRLKHSKPGLLSSANSGPDSNTGHFSIVVQPAPHLDGSYTVFGEVVTGFQTMYDINKLAGNAGGVTGSAIVKNAGCLQYCEPKQSVGPKCGTRSKEMSYVQQRRMYACLD